MELHRGISHRRRIQKHVANLSEQKTLQIEKSISKEGRKRSIYRQSGCAYHYHEIKNRTSTLGGIIKLLREMNAPMMDSSGAIL